MELIFFEQGRVGGLFEPDKCISFLLEGFEYGGEAIFYGEIYGVGSVARNFIDQLGITGCNNFPHTTTAGGTEYGG